MLYLTIVNKILRHCHSWLARQYVYLTWCYFQLKSECRFFLKANLSNVEVKIQTYYICSLSVPTIKLHNLIKSLLTEPVFG